MMLIALSSAFGLAMWIAWLIFGGYGPSVLPRGAVLGRRDQALVAACADALFPPNGPIPWSGTEAGIVQYVDEYVLRAPRPARRMVRLLLLFVELGPVVLGPRHARLSRQSVDERTATLAAMSDSPLYLRRIAFLSLRTLLTMGYLAHPGVAAQIGAVAQRRPFEQARQAAPVPAPAESYDTRDIDAAPAASNGERGAVA